MPRAARSLVRSKAVATLVVLLALGALVLPLPSGLIETWYSQRAYIHLQRLVTPVVNVVPVALLDLAGAVLVVFLIRHVVAILRSGRLRVTLPVLATHLAVFTASLYLLFLCLWGLNYRRLPLEQKLEFDRASITHAAAKQLATDAVRLVNADYDAAHAGSVDLGALTAPFDEAQRLLGGERLARPGVPKRSVLGLYFRWAAIDGMTDPFFLEVIVNPDVLPIERPFVVAHEWAHLAGYADESEANFVAWLVCTRGDALARYSGWLALYLHLSNALPRDDRRAVAALLGPGPRQDLLSISARFLQSTPVVRDAARDVYDSYLKANRVERGILSYDAVIRLVLGTRFDDGWRPALRSR